MDLNPASHIISKETLDASAKALEKPGHETYVLADLQESRPETCTCGPENLFGAIHPGVYDGIAWWHCRVCKVAWHRFSKDDDRRQRLETMFGRWPY